MNNMLRKCFAMFVFTVSAALLLPKMVFAQGAVVAFAPWNAQHLQTGFPTDSQLVMLTHILPMIGVSASTKTLSSSWNNARKSWFADLVNRAHQNGVQVIICISDISENKFVHATNSKNRPKFVKDIVDFVQKHGIDGVDINWERPGRDYTKGKNPPSIQQQIAEWEQCIALLDSLKARLPCKRISITISSSAPTSNRYHLKSPYSPDPPIPAQIWNIVDAIHLMTYDGQSGWQTHSHAGVSNNRIDAWAAWGEPKNLDKKKLFVACAFYGYNYKRDQSGNFILNSSGNKIFDTKVHYKDYDTTSCDNLGDLPVDVITKVNHSYNNGYGGVMIYQLAQDVPATDSRSLLNAIWVANEANSRNFQKKYRF